MLDAKPIVRWKTKDGVRMVNTIPGKLSDKKIIARHGG
jgi:hypothetical protein